MMFNFRIVSPRTAVAVACVGTAVVTLVSGCSHQAPAAAPGTSSTAGSTVSVSVSVSVATPSPTATAGVYGNPVVAAKYWQQQSLEDDCGLVSVADVVGEITGHAPTEQQIIALAQNTPSGTNPGPIYANGGGGVEMADDVVLLDHYGIKSVMTYSAHPEETGLPALERYLAGDRKIIAWVNSAVIWNTTDQRTKADHFLVVTGIDTGRDLVHLNDPGADHADEQVTVATFMTAWKAGQESIVVTAARN
jgi:Peptidase_C39 like family